MQESLPDFPCTPTREQAMIIIRNYFEQEACLSVAGENGVLREVRSAKFYAWLDDPRGRREKAQALDMLMERCGEHNDPT